VLEAGTLGDLSMSSPKAQDAASTARARYVKALRKQRSTGRTWGDIGREVGLTRRRVMRIAREP
jgi:hypothetical protein